MARAKSPPPSKSEAIRKYFAGHPGAAPKDAAAALGAQGISVSSQLIGNVKRSLGQVKRRRRKGKKRERPVGRPAVARGSVSLEVLLEAQKLVKRTGTIDEVRRALDALARLK